MTDRIRVRLGEQTYRVHRPYGDLPGPGLVSDVACCSRGHAFVLLRYDRYVTADGPAVVELDATGCRVAAWGEEILDGHKLAIDAQDRILVVDRDAHEVIVYRRDGQRLGGVGRRHEPGRPFDHPTDVAPLANGAMVVADGYAGASIRCFDTDGTMLRCWGGPGREAGRFRTPHAVAELADGRIVVADRDNDRLQVFTADGSLHSVWDDVVRPMDVWLDLDDGIFVTDQVPRLSRLGADGRLLGRCRPVLNGAHGGAVDHRGWIYLAEVNPSRLTCLIPE